MWFNAQVMRIGQNSNSYRKTTGKRWVMMLFGWFLIIISPIIGILPGPGFIILFPIGLAMVLRNSRFAKRQYIGFRRRFPAYGHWTDWALRRRGVKQMPKLPDWRETLKRLFSARGVV